MHRNRPKNEYELSAVNLLTMQVRTDLHQLAINTMTLDAEELDILKRALVDDETFEIFLSNEERMKLSARHKARLTPWNVSNYMIHTILTYGNIFGFHIFNGQRSVDFNMKLPRKCLCLHSCRRCDDYYYTRPAAIIDGRMLCNHANNKRATTFDKFLAKANLVYPDGRFTYAMSEGGFNFNQIDGGGGLDKEGRIQLTCRQTFSGRVCGYTFTAQIRRVMGHDTYCIKCAAFNKQLYTPQMLIDRIESNKPGQWDLTEIQSSNVVRYNTDDYIFMTCKKCHHRKNIRLSHVLYEYTDCSRCRGNISRGELAAMDYLRSLGYDPMRNYSFSGSKYRFDLVLHEDRIIFEIDGGQHFTRAKKWVTSNAHFKRKRKVDIIKTAMAVENGYRIVRIDDCAGRKMNLALETALQELNDYPDMMVSLSDLNKYAWIIYGLGAYFHPITGYRPEDGSPLNFDFGVDLDIPDDEDAVTYQEGDEVDDDDEEV